MALYSAIVKEGRTLSSLVLSLICLLRRCSHGIRDLYDRAILDPFF